MSPVVARNCSILWRISFLPFNVDLAKLPSDSSYLQSQVSSGIFSCLIFSHCLMPRFCNPNILSDFTLFATCIAKITQYSQRNKSVSSEGYSAQTELSITVNVRFTNNVNHTEDFERQFTSSKSYETTQSLASVQEELVNQMVKDLVEQIFNATVANW